MLLFRCPPACARQKNPAHSGNTAQFPPDGLSTAPAAAARHLRCQNARQCRVAVPASCFGDKSPSHSATAAPASVRCIRHWRRSPLQHKVLLFNDKITHGSKRTTREKLLSYLSAESIRQSSLSFDRQQLADFLCVERSAMSMELSKLQKEGLLVTKRNHFELLTR